jgi:hypothetical protein
MTTEKHTFCETLFLTKKLSGGAFRRPKTLNFLRFQPSIAARCQKICAKLLRGTSQALRWQCF